MPMKILVADDNRDAADTLALLLTSFGYHVRVAYDGRAALAQAVADPPTCAILDIGMPQMDGYAVARQLRADPATQGAKLVAYTGYGDAESIAAGRAAGFDCHFVKGTDGPAEVICAVGTR
jgi:CheY-like chemotaxis protein